MTEQRALDTWHKIVKILEEKLQYGFLEQANAVVNVAVEGSELTLSVATDEAFEFFNAETNQQRLYIFSRTILPLTSIQVIRVDAEPIKE